MQQFLAFDLGAETGRAMFGTLDGARLALREVHRFENPTSRLNGRLCWNLPAQWEQLKAGLRKCSSMRLDSIGIDTWGVDFGLIGRDGRLLGLPGHYRDSRTDGMVQLAIERVGRERIYRATGGQFMQINTLYQLLAMREERSPQLEAAETLLLMPDLFNYLLTGERRAEYTIATTTQMFDPVQQRWATDLLESLDLPTHVLPDVVPSGTTVGRLSDAVATECGVELVRVIAPGSHDTVSAVAAVPARETSSGWCYISSGTWSLMGVEVDRPIIDERSMNANFTNEGGVCGTVRLLKNIVGLWLVQECRRELAGAGQENSYAELMDMAQHARCDSIIDTDDPQLLAPGNISQKIEAGCRQTKQPVPSNPGELVRVCLRSLAAAYRATLDALEPICGRAIHTIHIVGGGSQNDLLNQMTADACERTVIAGPVEATAMGNILVQAMAAGRVSSLAELRQIVRNSCELKRFEPQGRAAR